MISCIAIVFVWDNTKNNSNIQKHGVSFAEASTVFLDDNAIVIDDEEHSEYEERFIIIGFSSKLRLLVVCHCYRESGFNSNIRIISARKANKKECEIYEGEK